MKSYFEGFEQEDAELIESMSKAAYELRENRKILLEQHGIEEEKALLERLANGTIPEHPAYEHYLSASILAGTHETVREELGNILQKAKLI